MERFFQILAVILAGVAAYFLWRGESDRAFVTAVFGAVSFFLSVRFEVKARLDRRAAEDEARFRAETAAADDEADEDADETDAANETDEASETDAERAPRLGAAGAADELEAARGAARARDGEPNL